MNRNPWFDNIKGFLVILVVIGPMLTDLRFDYDGKLLETVYLLIYSFHMPLFIILSSYFFRENKYLRVIQLFAVYCVWQILIGSWATLGEGLPLLSGENIGTHLLRPYWALWYLFVLVVWYIVTPYVVRLRGYVWFGLAFALLYGFELENTGFLALRKLIMFYPYFLLGNYLSEHEFIRISEMPKNFKRRMNVRLIGGITLAAVTGFLLFEAWRDTPKEIVDFANVFKHRFPYVEQYDSDAWVGVLKHSVIYLLSIAASLGLMMLIPMRRLPLITRAGELSLYVYLLHVFFVIAWRQYVTDAYVPQAWLALLIMIGVALLIVGIIIPPLVVRVLCPLIVIDIRPIGEKREDLSK
jgi:fucose 4-O-acetylase-like acetyltransferase